MSGENPRLKKIFTCLSIGKKYKQTSWSLYLATVGLKFSNKCSRKIFQLEFTGNAKFIDCTIVVRIMKFQFVPPNLVKFFVIVEWCHKFMFRDPQRSLKKQWLKEDRDLWCWYNTLWFLTPLIFRCKGWRKTNVSI